MYLGVKELIEEKSEISLGASCWTPPSTKLSIPWHRPSIAIIPECFGVYYGIANILGASAPTPQKNHV